MDYAKLDGKAMPESQTITDQVTLESSAGGVFSIPGFDPALGTLTSVLLSEVIAPGYTVTLADLSPVPFFFSAEVSNSASLVDADGTVVGALAGSEGQTGSILSGQTIIAAAGTLLADGSATPDAFIGAAPHSFTLANTISLGVHAEGDFADSLIGGGGPSTLTVQYVFQPPAPPPPPQQTLTVEQDIVIPELAAGQATTVATPYFDASLGTLVSVEVEGVTDVTATNQIENIGNIPGSASTTLFAGLKVDYANPVGAFLSFNDTLGAYDGTLDYAGLSGTTETVGTVTPAQAIDIPIDNLGDGAPITVQGIIDASNGTANIANTQTVSAESSGTLEFFFNYIACFAAGTRIATPQNEATVESLRPGDLVRSALRGQARVSATFHRRVVPARHARPADVLPVRIRAHAFGPDQPARDLLLSPDHAIYAEGVLVPIKYLCNGVSVGQVTADVVTYWHVELDQHDVLLAENLPAESYLDIDGRAAVYQAGAGGGAPAPRVWDAAACAPLVVTGAAVDRLRARLAART